MIHETRLIFWSHLRANLRNPAWAVIMLMQPLLYLVLFGPLLENLGGAYADGSDPWLVFTPGMVLMIALFGSAFAGFGLVAELRSGVVERQRVTPASRNALLLGRVAKDMTVLVAQAVVLIGIAIAAFGVRPDPLGMVATLALVALVGVAFASASYALALKTRSEDGMASTLNSLTVPLLLLSGILLPMTLAPGWLEALSRINPLSHTVDAVRAMFASRFDTAEVVTGTLVTLAFAVVLGYVGTRTFQRENA
ncbi:ABC transporter permease [Actinobacteria bacterium YIM 96077]|uniref:Transport permease protein n=1 Tax=Phytoactinopolyspora halophila TaxID=1981511 RepID=A0A329R782_9ACTN|nr:ABC transporter permease [Phytoactinopolyspora halophila]AYY15255.1 ABC transporter permease [Actinobacteria bacterium YIM 96077]RAW18948.1 ABC transporter permease [Phytoactinopolyspora halophila]